MKNVFVLATELIEGNAEPEDDEYIEIEKK